MLGYKATTRKVDKQRQQAPSHQPPCSIRLGRRVESRTSRFGGYQQCFYSRSVKPATSFTHHNARERRWNNTTRANSNSELKAPTQIAVSDPTRWGFAVSDTEASFKWFKLGLPHDDELQDDLLDAAELDEARALRRQHKVKTSELVEAYMKALWDQCVNDIALAENMERHDVLETMMFVVIGTPANWGLGTLASLLKAARDAGIPGEHCGSKVETCLEPEAAAMGLLMHDKPKIQKVVELKVSLGARFLF